MALLTRPAANPPSPPFAKGGDGGISQRTVLMRVYQCCVVRFSVPSPLPENNSFRNSVRIDWHSPPYRPMILRAERPSNKVMKHAGTGVVYFSEDCEEPWHDLPGEVGKETEP